MDGCFLSVFWVKWFAFRESTYCECQISWWLFRWWWSSEQRALCAQAFLSAGYDALYTSYTTFSGSGRRRRGRPFAGTDAGTLLAGRRGGGGRSGALNSDGSYVRRTQPLSLPVQIANDTNFPSSFARAFHNRSFDNDVRLYELKMFLSLNSSRRRKEMLIGLGFISFRGVNILTELKNCEREWTWL